MALSSTAIQSAQALETPNAWLMLMTIVPAVGDTMYIVNNTEAITSNGQEYIAYPFAPVLSTDDGEKLPEVSIVIDNVHRDLVEAIRTLLDPPTVTIQLVLSEYPDDVEMTISDLVLRNVTYDQFTIQGKLYTDDLLSSRHPEGSQNLSGGYLGLFRGSV